MEPHYVEMKTKLNKAWHQTVADKILGKSKSKGTTSKIIPTGRA